MIPASLIAMAKRQRDDMAVLCAIADTRAISPSWSAHLEALEKALVYSLNKVYR